MKTLTASDVFKSLFPAWQVQAPAAGHGDSPFVANEAGAEQALAGENAENIALYDLFNWQTSPPPAPRQWQPFISPEPLDPIDLGFADMFADHFEFQTTAPSALDPTPSNENVLTGLGSFPAALPPLPADPITPPEDEARQDDADPDLKTAPPPVTTVAVTAGLSNTGRPAGATPGTPVVTPHSPPPGTDNASNGRPLDATPGAPVITPPSPPPGTDNASNGRPLDATPDLPPEPVLLDSYTSGGAPATSYNVTIEFEGTWTIDLQAAFIDAADYLGSIILSDIPDVIVNSVLVDDISITATLDEIDGTGGILGSAGPKTIRLDGTFLPPTAEMTFDVADAQNMLTNGLWETVVLHEMLHSLGFGTLWSLMGLTSGFISTGNLRFTGPNATDIYNVEFPDIAGPDRGSDFGVPVETDGGPGTAGGHWDELLFDAEIMTGYVDTASFVSLMTIAALEDMGYDTVFDNPYSATDLSGAIPVDPLFDLIA